MPAGESRRAPSGTLVLGGAPGAAGHPGQLLDRLDTDLQEFRLQFGRFFAGDRPVPPDDLRQELQARLRQARGGGASGVRSVADTFRLTQLEAQFNTYNELFNRRLRQREEGPRRPGAGRVVAPPLAAESKTLPPSQPSSTPAASATSNGGPSPEVVVALHRSLYPPGAQGAGADVPDLERFGAFLATQAESLRRRTGCHDVVFRVSGDGGRRKLLAKPVGGSTPAPHRPD